MRGKWTVDSGQGAGMNRTTNAQRPSGEFFPWILVVGCWLLGVDFLGGRGETGEGTYHGGTETRRRNGVNVRRFLRRNHAQSSAMVLLEWDRRIAELEMTQLFFLPVHTVRANVRLPISDLREHPLRVSVPLW